MLAKVDGMVQEKCKQLQKNLKQEIVSQDFAASGKVYKNIVVFYTNLCEKAHFVCKTSGGQLDKILSTASALDYISMHCNEAEACAQSCKM